MKGECDTFLEEIQEEHGVKLRFTSSKFQVLSSILIGEGRLIEKVPRLWKLLLPNVDYV